MGSFSIWHWIIVLLIVLLLFGAGKLPKVMGDLAKGVKSFKAGLQDDSDDATPGANAQGANAKTIPNQPANTAEAAAKKDEAVR
ncbi:twin-arginine translocase TatA/TatE family subunit [Azospirillum melinis]|uniref:Sec-independent protein translocase protein TatA n=1 Tax=Azospirillum melinis TaxID=328839 RepID=A0ABX2KPE5_9PROT|nr:twin-arginine translocase TatA/TatE family subunit [Azospirillum melinis]MBP2307276.1 sec-independent protein translocase protein TatA [Azospirillum melinis]NUB04246.1 twin-arginine translocase TatA/TatE family subunit [Azospirillum melinis]